MNGYERIRAALRGEPSDKVPVMLHNFMMAAYGNGITMEQFRNSPKLIAESFIKSVEIYQFDGILVDIDTVTLAGALGVPVDFPVHEPARTHLGLISSLDELHMLKPVRVENYKYIQIWLEAVRLIKAYFGDEIFVRGNCDQAPFTLAGMMRGIQNWMTDLMTEDESRLEELLEYCTAATCRFVELMAQTGADMVSNGDSPAGPEMISGEMYEKFALPYEKRVVDLAHGLGLPYALHICGNTEIILESMLKTGADALELDYKTDCRRVFDAISHTACLIGNIDPSGVLALGTPELVHARTIELLEVYGNFPRFILNAGCAIPPSTPPENLKTMVETARMFRVLNDQAVPEK